MIQKHVLVEIERIEQGIKFKKERMDKLKRLAKLSKNEDLISEYDAIIKQAESNISTLTEAREPIDAHKEQVFTHGWAAIKTMAKGLKESICSSEKQIEFLNNSIEDDNRKIDGLKERKHHGGII